MTKKLLTYITASIVCPCLATAQTLFTFGGKPVPQAEFLRAFEKNPEAGDRKKALADYLPLYINYKLKVQDALDKKMDTLPTQKTEASNYRAQLEESFINEKANTSQLVEEAFERSQKDILLGHLFIGFDPKDSASMAKANEAAAKAQTALKTGQDFAAVVRQYSTDESNKASGGLAGWITVFSIPYHYETAVYSQPIGGTTQTISGSAGLHIFKKIAERPAAGKVKVAQIMLVNADKENAANEENTKRLADSLYTALQNGASFDALAQKFSNDRTSYGTGGVLPEFGVGSYDTSFENQAFALQTKGDISKPFQTEFGWHILKLIEKKPVAGNLAEADANGQLRQKVLGGNRTETAKAQYINSLLPKMSHKPANFVPQQLWLYTDSAVRGGSTKGMGITSKTPVFTFGTQPITAAEWVQYVKTVKASAQGKAIKAYPELLKDFTQFAAADYYRKNLERLEPTFAQQLKEFTDANLLFEAMDKTVWSKAANDSASLLQYYGQHKDNYKWGASASALLVTTTDTTITDEVLAAIKADPANWRETAEKYNGNLIADSGRYEYLQIPVAGPTQFSSGMLTAPVTNEMDGSQTFAYIFNLLPAGTQRSFEEARGFVINDYQQVLEERWLASLKRKYPVKVNEAVWKKLLAAEK